MTSPGMRVHGEVSLVDASRTCRPESVDANKDAAPGVPCGASSCAQATHLAAVDAAGHTGGLGRCQAEKPSC